MIRVIKNCLKFLIKVITFNKVSPPCLIYWVWGLWSTSVTLWRESLLNEETKIFENVILILRTRQSFLLPLKSMVLSFNDFVLRGIFGSVWKHFWLWHWGAGSTACIQWVEASYAGKHFTKQSPGGSLQCPRKESTRSRGDSEGILISLQERSQEEDRCRKVKAVYWKWKYTLESRSKLRMRW